MAKKPEHSGEQWTGAQEKRLQHLATGNTPTGLIADDLGRSEAAIRSKAAEIDVSLKPTNQSPYNRRKQ
jgi:hypothetical protein